MLRISGVRKLLIGIGGALLIVLLGYWVYFTLLSADPLIVSPAPTQDAMPAKTSPPAPTLLVHIAGAVHHPGVYHIPPGTLPYDALHIAGGPRTDANLDKVNLAKTLKHGTRLYVPYVKKSPGKYRRPIHSYQQQHHLLKNPICINSSSYSTLLQLPRVGPKMATRIITYRQKSGGFRSVDDLKNVKGIGDKVFSQILPYITIGAFPLGFK